jgi:hypothetical protein
MGSASQVTGIVIESILGTARPLVLKLETYCYSSWNDSSERMELLIFILEINLIQAEQRKRFRALESCI